MAFRWRFFGVASTIIVYIAGILILSIVNLQNPQQRRFRNGKLYGDNNLNHNNEIGLLKRAPLKWCSELKFLGSNHTPFALKTVKPMQTFPGHYVKTYKQFILEEDSVTLKSDRSLPETKSNSFDDSFVDSFSTNNNNKNNKLSDNDSEFIIKSEPLEPIINHKPKLINDNSFDTNMPKDNIVALASFPGSGNTWLRYLLQQATGILTGSVYKDYGLLKSGFPAESISNGSVLVVKTHEWGPNSWNRFSRAILLVRDPAKAILAEFNRQSGGHVGFASPDRYKRTKGRYWMKFVKSKLFAWEQTNLSWGKNFTGDLQIIYYDNLVEDVEGSLREILRFLKFPINEDLLACTISRKEGIYRRKKRLLTFDPYSPVMHRMIDGKRSEVYAELGRTKPVKVHL